MAAIDWEAAITVLNAGPDREVVAVGVAFSMTAVTVSGVLVLVLVLVLVPRTLSPGLTWLMGMAASEASRTFVPTVNDSPQPCSTRPSSIVVSSVVNQL
jgi:uncharacterized membrane-anchored protein